MRTLLAILLSAVGAWAVQPVDTTRLPISAERKIDFATDIQPLLDRSCMKCHGDKRPKSDYRLTSREAALVGGEIGVAILPGDSANSPLVHYIAGLIEDSEMPPEGKAPALSRDEISLVRGWIDQGAAWAASTKTVFTAEPTARWISLSGSSDDDRPFEVADKASTPVENAQRLDLRQYFNEEINKLPRVFREVIELRDVQELSYDEISIILKVPLGTVKSRVNRGRHRLKKKLGIFRKIN